MNLTQLASSRKSFSAGLAIAVLFSLLLALLSGCAALTQITSKKPVYPQEVTGADRADFNSAEARYKSREYDEAAKAYQTYIDTHGYNRLTDEALYKQGKIQFIKRDLNSATQKFLDLADKTPDPEYRAKGLHMAGYAQYKNNEPALAVATLKRVEPVRLQPLLRMQYYSLHINAASAGGHPDDSADAAALSLYDLYEDQAQAVRAMNAPDLVSREQLRNILETWVARPLEELPLWARKYPAGPARAFVDYKTARTYHEQGLAKKARRSLSVFINNYPKNMYYGQALALLSELGGPEKIKSGGAFRVGLLLPLAGGGYADAVLQGVRCAAGENGACGGASNIALIVRDAGFTPDSVRQGIDDLSVADVAGIISILPGQMAVEAAMHATEKHVPIVLISQQEGLMKHGDQVFQMGFSPERQIRELVKAATDRGLKQFGIFHPNITYGQKMAALFTEAVTSRGGRILATMGYNKDGDLYTDARRFKMEIDVATANPSADPEQPDQPATGNRLDAIFIPDSYQTVNAVASALSFNQIASVPLIGTNTWNDPSLSSTIAGNFPGSFFIDIYDAQAPTAEVRDFRERFSASFGTDPEVLNAMGFDAMMMIRAAVSRDGEKKVATGLSEKLSYKGVTGISGFKPGQAPIIRPKVITLQQFTADNL